MGSFLLAAGLFFITLYGCYRVGQEAKTPGKPVLYVMLGEQEEQAEGLIRYLITMMRFKAVRSPLVLLVEDNGDLTPGIALLLSVKEGFAVIVEDKYSSPNRSKEKNALCWLDLRRPGNLHFKLHLIRTFIMGVRGFAEQN